MTLDLEHLAKSAREHAFLASDERIRHVHTARWISYPRGEVILEHLQRLIAYPTCARMPCLLLYGESGIGKTMILEKFSRTHRPGWDNKRGVEIRPVLLVQMPPAPDERRLSAACLGALNAPHLHSAKLWSLEQVALSLLQQISVRALIFDEVQHVLAGSQREQRRALNVIKSLANHLRVSVISVGTRDALQAFQTDPQMVTRFEPFELPRWIETDAFRSFLNALQRELPLRKASSLADRDCTQLLLRRSDGITGTVCWIVGQAAEEAIRSGAECIDVALIDRVSQRLRALPH